MALPLLHLMKYNQAAEATSIALDATSYGEDVSSGTTLTWNHTCSGTNRLLTVSLGTTPQTTYPTVTYNGIAMTPVSGAHLDGGSWRSIVYYLVAPPTGTHQVSVTFPTKTNRFATAASFNGVYQGSPLGSWGGGRDAAGVNKTDVITTFNNNSLVVGAFITTGGSSVTVGASGQTQIALSTDGRQTSGYKIFTTAGNNNFTWVNDGSTYTQSMAEFKAVSEVPTYSEPYVCPLANVGATSIHTSSSSMSLVSYQLRGYMKWSEYRIKYSGTFRITHRTQNQSTSAGTGVYTQIWKNGVPYGPEYIVSGSTAIFTRTDDLTFNAGDYIQLYVKNAAGLNNNAGDLTVLADAACVGGIEIIIDR